MTIGVNSYARVYWSNFAQKTAFAASDANAGNRSLHRAVMK